MMYMSYKYFELANESKNEEKDETEEVKIFLEEIGGIYYAWHVEPEEFIVQTKTVSDMVGELSEIFKNTKIMIKTTKEIECQLNELNQQQN